MLIYGKNVCKEAIKNKQKIKNIYVTKNFNEDFIKNLHVHYLEKYEMDKKVDGLHQGIIMEVDDFKYDKIDSLFNSDNNLVIILDHLEDPHNFGAIIRTCEAAGVKAIIIPKDRSVSVNATVVKVSTGAISDISIIQVTNLSQTIELLKKHGYWIVGTDMTGESYDKIDYKGNTVIIIGNEGKGMGTNIKNNCDFIATIPMNGKTNSLNASVAAGIIIFEAVKNRRS